MNKFLLFLWAIAFCRRQLLLTSWWQIKEYRLDRFWVFLKTKEGQRKTEIFLLLAKLLLLAAAIFFKPLSYFYPAILLAETAKLSYELLSRQLKRPKITFRSLIFLFNSFLPVIIFLSQREKLNLSLLIFFDLLGFFILPASAFLTDIPLKIVLKFKRRRVVSALNQYNPQVIAITGSYAKSSTKHLLFELLKDYAPTVKTPASYNTELGIMKAIKSLNRQTKYFLCEMGAYKKGEIKALCQLVKPDFALITGIAPQHLALFGSKENLLKTKYEIAQSLKPKGVLFVNATHPSTKPIIQRAQKDRLKIITYALKDTQQKADFLGLIIKKSENETVFKINSRQGQIKFTTNKVFPQDLENLTGALAVALTLKVPQKHLKKVVANLPEIDSGIKIKIISPSITLLDDSYNSNPVGFEAALGILAKSKGFKILVSDGIKELGKNEFTIHKNLGKKSRFANLILTTSPSLLKSFQAGLGKDKEKIHLVRPNIKLEELKELIKTPATILLEGRLPSSLVKTISKLN